MTIGLKTFSSVSHSQVPKNAHQEMKKTGNISELEN